MNPRIIIVLVSLIFILSISGVVIIFATRKKKEDSKTYWDCSPALQKCISTIYPTKYTDESSCKIDCNKQLKYNCDFESKKCVQNDNGKYLDFGSCQDACQGQSGKTCKSDTKSCFDCGTNGCHPDFNGYYNCKDCNNTCENKSRPNCDADNGGGGGDGGGGKNDLGQVCKKCDQNKKIICSTKLAASIVKKCTKCNEETSCDGLVDCLVNKCNV